jgi:transposase-like protein
VVDATFSARYSDAAGEAFFAWARTETEVHPKRVTTNTATYDPPALCSVLPGVGHRRSRHLHTGLARDHCHLKQRVRPMRCFTFAHAGYVVSRGHVVVEHLRNSVSRLTASVARNLRLATAWPQSAQAI